MSNTLRSTLQLWRTCCPSATTARKRLVDHQAEHQRLFWSGVACASGPRTGVRSLFTASYLTGTPTRLSGEDGVHSSSHELSVDDMANVEYSFLGSSGLKVSNICLGTMVFGIHPQGRPGCREDEAHSILDKFVELGGNFIDTADIYQNGLSETIVGNWLNKHKAERYKYVVATKCGKMKEEGSNPNTVGGSRHAILSNAEQSLKRLQTDYIDIFYLHVWDDGTPVEETLRALNDLVRWGKVRYVAVSNLKGWQLQKMVETARYKAWAPITCLQEQYNLLCRSTEWEVAEVCEREGVALLPWSPLKGGWLSGKIKSGDNAPPPDSRVAWSKGRAHHSHPDWEWFSSNTLAWDVLGHCETIANARGKTVAQVALRWLLQRPAVPSVVIGVRTMEQLLDNMGASGWRLDKAEMKALNEASTISSPYPYDYVAKDNRTFERLRPST